MGYCFEATCLDCRERFEASEGGGFAFHLLRCDRCGRPEAVGFDESDGRRWDSIKGPGGPDGMAPAGGDQGACREPVGEPTSPEVYHRRVEASLGPCGCGGRFRFDAPVRCPACRSSNVERGETGILYD